MVYKSLAAHFDVLKIVANFALACSVKRYWCSP